MQTVLDETESVACTKSIFVNHSTTSSAQHHLSNPIVHRLKAETAAFDRIINSPSTEFDTLSAEGLAGLTDYREDLLYPGELDEDCLHENNYSSSTSGTPLSLRRRGLSELSATSETPPERRKLIELEESQDILTALPPPPPPILREERVVNFVKQQSLPSRSLRPNIPAPPPPLTKEIAKIVNKTESPRQVERTTPSPVNHNPPILNYHKSSSLASTIIVANSNNNKKKNMSHLAEEEFSQNSEPMESSSDGVGLRNVFNAQSCQVKFVTVYLDRAEVCRLIRPRVQAGESEILIKRLSPAIDKDSIRVEVKGPATIADVSYSAKHNKDEEAEKVRLKEAAQEQLQIAQRMLDALNQKQLRIIKQRDVLNSFADTLIKKPESSTPSDAKETATATSTTTIGNQNVVDAFDPKHMQTLGSFLELYENQASKLDEDLIQVRVDIQKKEEKIKDLEKELRDIEARFAEILSREVSIVLDSQETTQLELSLSYIVNRAKWSPKYDIRVFSNESVMKIIYYGLVQQNTGEDWENAQISLSTSQPGVGGTVPVLGVQKAHFKQSKPMSMVNGVMTGGPVSPVRRAQSMRYSKKQRATLDEQLQSLEAASDDTSVTANEGDKFKSMQDTLRSEANVASAHFDVPRLFSIPSDNEEHKVTIAIIDLSPTFEFESVPQKAQYAYLKANVTNTSPYALLAGPTNIYVDNNFIAKSDLKAAAPLEEFSCHLGADHGIKVIYKPMFKKKESGPGKTVTYAHRQVIEMRNNHQKPVKILVMESVPLATEDKIKVNLLEPVIKHPEKYDRSKPIRLNKSSCVEWDVELGPGEAKELTLRYNIDHPPNEILDYTVSEA